MPRLVLLIPLLFLACAPQRSASPSTPSAPAATAEPSPSSTARAAAGAMTYVAIGASDTVGVGASDPATRSWPAVLRSRMPTGTKYLNLGVSGSTVAQAIAQQLPEAATRGADAGVVTVWLAVNDLNAGVDPAAYQADLGRLLDGLLRASAARIFIGDVPDLTRVPVYAGVEPQALAARVAAYNGAIAAVVSARKDRVVRVDLFTGSDAILKESVVAPDGFHPNDRGYALVAERFADAMRQAGLPVS